MEDTHIALLHIIKPFEEEYFSNILFYITPLVYEAQASKAPNRHNYFGLLQQSLPYFSQLSQNLKKLHLNLPP